MSKSLPFVLLFAFGVFASTASAYSIPLLMTSTLSGNVDSAHGQAFENVGYDGNVQFVGFSFVLGRPFKDVSITLNDIFYFGTPGNVGGPQHLPGLAYLTNGIGIGATSQNTIATAPFSQNASLPTLEQPNGSYTLFGNLDLGPGTYYFLLTVPHGGWGNWGAPGTPVSSTFTQAPGVGFLNILSVDAGCFPKCYRRRTLCAADWMRTCGCCCSSGLRVERIRGHRPVRDRRNGHAHARTLRMDARFGSSLTHSSHKVEDIDSLVRERG
jgi:hypothetical protein